MNPHKLRAILELVRRQGKLPIDQWGNVLSPDDLLVWYGLTHLLTPDERSIVKRELADMTEAEEFMDRLRSTPVHLCRLRHFRKDEWSVAFFTYSREEYEPSFFA